MESSECAGEGDTQVGWVGEWEGGWVGGQSWAVRGRPECVGGGEGERAGSLPVACPLPGPCPDLDMTAGQAQPA